MSMPPAPSTRWAQGSRPGTDGESGRSLIGTSGTPRWRPESTAGARTEHTAGAPVPADLLRGEGPTIAQTRPRHAANLGRAAEGDSGVTALTTRYKIDTTYISYKATCSRPGGPG